MPAPPQEHAHAGDGPGPARGGPSPVRSGDVAERYAFLGAGAPFAPGFMAAERCS